MSYKKLVSLLAASTLALVACGEDTAQEEPATEETAEEADTEETTDEGEDTFDRAAERETEGTTVSVGLEVIGSWTTDGYVVMSEGATAEVMLTAIPAEDVENFYIYLTDEEGKIVEKFENEEEVVYTVEGVDSEMTFHAGTSEEDLGDVDDTIDNPEEDFVRHENVIVQPGEEAPAEEE
ncbi:MAG TPA: hypothetical protein VK107_03525 [Alloiococcus sp.]|nr:hypothetical protein [Alloiococcus sp.]